MTKASNITNFLKNLNLKDGLTYEIFDDVIEKRQLTKDLVIYLEKLALLEAYYAKKLKSIATEFILPKKKNNLVDMLDDLKTNTLRRAKQSQEFSDSITKDILETMLNVTLKNHSVIGSKIENDITSLTECHEKLVKDINKTKWEVKNFGVSLLSSLSSAQISLLSYKQNVVAPAFLKSYVQLRRVEEKYQSEIAPLNLVRQACLKAVKHMSTAFEDMDKKLIACVNDSIRKFLVYETNYFRNLEYDHNLLVSQINDIELKSETNVREIINLSTNFEPIQPSSWIQICMEPSLKREQKNTYSFSFGDLFNSFNAYDNEMDDFYDTPFIHDVQVNSLITKIKSEFNFQSTINALETEEAKEAETQYKIILDALWKNDNDLSVKKTEECLDTLNNNLNRLLLIKMLTEKYCKKELKLPSMSNLKQLGVIIQQILIQCDNLWDIFGGLAIMVLSQKFYAVGKLCEDPQLNQIDSEESSTNEVQNDNLTAEAKPVIWFLHRVIYHMPIWNRVQFWQNAVEFILSYQIQNRVMENLLDKKVEKSCWIHEILNENLLEMFGHCMLSFGIVEPQITSLFNIICCRYNLEPELKEKLLTFLNKEDYVLKLPCVPELSPEENSMIYPYFPENKLISETSLRSNDLLIEF